jgi:predicted ribosome quality control (RQC) complex YloA/Tae2 family protein
MPLDALCLSAAAAELKAAAVGARVDKIQQPEKDVFLFS